MIRNRIYMMRQFGRHDLALQWALVQCVAKPLVTLFSSPRNAYRGFLLGWKASLDGFLANMGRTVDPGAQ